MIATSLNDPIYFLLRENEIYATAVKRDVLISYIVENRLPRGHFIAKPELGRSGLAAISLRGEVRTVMSNSILFLIDWLKTDGKSDNLDYNEESCPYCVNQVLVSNDAVPRCPECGMKVTTSEEV